ncbi:MAG: sodium:calcium antiporter [Candidatus Pacebacteria bacterium]|nr:sodium:calcium antiporter [Candidatus Paceibacterota bacterium]
MIMLSVELYILVFILAFLAIAKSSDFLVGSLSYLSRAFGISEYLAAFIFMSLATSFPELFVGITSSLKGIPEFSLGNILGANIINITLVIGLIIFIGNGLKVEGKISKRNFWIISIAAFLPIFLASDGMVSRSDGALLILAFILYLLTLYKEKEYFSKTISLHNGLHPSLKIFGHLLFFALALVILILSANAIVWAGENLAAKTTLGIMLFGAVFVSLGTALPEVAFGVRARLKRHVSMAIGNSLGSVAFNSTFIVGLVGLINPIKTNISFDFVFLAFTLFLGLFMFNMFVFSKAFISKKEGAALLAVYGLFLAFECCKYFLPLF